MYDTNSEHLEMRWHPVTDPDGRTHMEACWVTAGQASSSAGHAA